MIQENLETAFDHAYSAGIEQDELSFEEFNLVSGGYPCDYLGVHDYVRMQSYYSRFYCC